MCEAVGLELQRNYNCMIKEDKKSCRKLETKSILREREREMESLRGESPISV